MVKLLKQCFVLILVVHECRDLIEDIARKEKPKEKDMGEVGDEAERSDNRWSRILKELGRE